MCAGDIKSGRGPCQGDSGGPLVARFKKKILENGFYCWLLIIREENVEGKKDPWALVGLVSWRTSPGKSCSQTLIWALIGHGGKHGSKHGRRKTLYYFRWSWWWMWWTNIHCLHRGLVIFVKTSLNQKHKTFCTHLLLLVLVQLFVFCNKVSKYLDWVAEQFDMVFLPWWSSYLEDQELSLKTEVKAKFYTSTPDIIYWSKIWADFPCHLSL